MNEEVLKKFSVDPAVNGYPALLRAGEGEGGEEEGVATHLYYTISGTTVTSHMAIL